MNIIILGGSGFVGTRLTEILLPDHNITIGDITQSCEYPGLWRNCDVCNDDDLRQVLPGHDCIINLASAHRDDVRPVSLYHKTNVKGAEHVCKIAGECGIKHILFTSSVAIYGFPEWDYEEDGPKNPFNEYGRTKLLSETVYKKWQQQEPENKLHIVRPTVIFGENNKGNVYNLFCQLASGRFIMVGKGENKKSMAYVGNVAAFLKWNIEYNQAKCSVYNYVDKPDLNMNELIHEFERILNKKLPGFSLPYWLGLCGGYCFDFLAFVLRRNFSISSIRVKKFCAQTVFNSDKMLQSSFVPPYSMNDALRRTIEFEFMSGS